ncbi:MAG: hypothetical protein DRJ35_08545, partial [Thermoprotei archaeon]
MLKTKILLESMLTPLEIISLLFSVIVLIKIVAILPNRKMIAKKTRTALKHVDALETLMLISAVIIGYFVFSAMSIVQIVAVMFLTSFLFGMVLYAIPESVEAIYKAMSKKKLNK